MYVGRLVEATGRTCCYSNAWLELLDAWEVGSWLTFGA